jgi:selenocysteine-specific elongation factor
MYVIGTAGHVDHGKSTLVRALTGIDPDRLQEEKDRGMTIDLGFAWLKLPSGREVSIVDVPGHERFIKNMLAGVGGIDLALFVVAADESVMPQTREHLAILDLLQVRSGLVAVTKRDLVDEEWLELVIAEIEDTLKPTTLAGAPIFPVSSTTGEGLDALKAEIDRLLEHTPTREDRGRPRLPIDRVFTIAGFGTVVTGTLLDGRLKVGQEVEVLPGGLHSRVRGLQTHRHKVEAAEPSSRTAVNLTGLATTDLTRGDVLTAPGWLRPTTALDVRLRAVAGLPKPIKHNARVTFHTGSAEVPGRVRLLDAQELAPGESAWAQVKLDAPVAVVKGDYFVIRSPETTLGGGAVVEPIARRHRRFRAQTLDRLATLEKGTPAEVLAQTLRQVEPAELRTVLDRAGLDAPVARAALAALLESGDVVALGATANGPAPNTNLITLAGWQDLAHRARQAVAGYHHQYPLRAGMPREELKSRLSRDVPGGRLTNTRVFNEVAARLLSEGEILESGASVRLPDHAVTLNPRQQAEVDAFLAALRAEPYSPPTDHPPEPELLNALVDRRDNVRVAEGVWFATEAYEQMVARIRDHLAANGKITVAEVRDLFNTSRKYALALMEHLDEIKVTRRLGDERVLR